MERFADLSEVENVLFIGPAFEIRAYPISVGVSKTTVFVTPGNGAESGLRAVSQSVS